jgi:hypothetical protein
MYLKNKVVKIIGEIIMGMEKNVESFHFELFSSLVKQMDIVVPDSGESIYNWMGSLDELFKPKYQARYFVNGFLTK